MFDSRPGEEEIFVRGIYSSMDEAIASELYRLSRVDSTVPSCRPGCSHCCRHHILTNILEARVLAQYIRRELPLEQIDALRVRTGRWHAWDSSRPGRRPSPRLEEQSDLSRYDPCCPLVVDAACIAYPVRPIVCRTHFVRSPPLLCSEANNPESNEAIPVVLVSVLAETSQLSRAMKEHIENAGIDFSRSIMLLPQWLAIEMAWEFAVSP